MEQQSKILVAGITGMVGASIARQLVRDGYKDILGTYHIRKPNPALWISHSHYPASDFSHEHAFSETESDLLVNNYKLDLTDQAQVKSFFESQKPEYVFLAAAKVGGILANSTYPADFIRDNLLIQTHVIDAAFRSSVKKLLFLGSSCIYPKFAPQPMHEKHLLTGELEPTNQWYAIAKIAGIKMCQAFRKQHGFDAISIMPTNLYGPGDNFNLQNSHVLPALLRKFHLARLATNGDIRNIQKDIRNFGPVPDDILSSLGLDRDATRLNHSIKPTVILWGTGSPRREFLHVDDLARVSVFLMNNYSDDGFVNVGVGEDVTIRELAEMVREVVGYEGDVVFDSSKPDGTPRKLLDVSRLNDLGWKASVSLKEGIAETYRWYLKQ